MTAYTFEQSGGDFSSLSAALSDAGTVSGDTFTTSSAWTADDSTAATVADDNITITVTGSAAHPGYVDTTQNHYRLVVSTGAGGACLTVNNTGCNASGLVINNSAGGGSNEGIRMGADTGTLTVSKLIIYSTLGASTADQDGIHCPDISATINATNCIVYGFSRAGFCVQPFNGADTQTWNVNSCAFWDNGQDDNDGDCGGIGVKGDASPSSTQNINVFNSWSMNNATAATGTGGSTQSGDFNDEGLGTSNWNIDYCISSDATITARDSGAVSALEDHNLTDDNTKASDGNWVIVEDITTASTYDLRLQSNTYNEAQDYHSSSTGAGLSIPSDDIVGTSRPQNSNYDVGAFEIVSVGGVANPKGVFGLSLRGPFGGMI